MIFFFLCEKTTKGPPHHHPLLWVNDVSGNLLFKSRVIKRVPHLRMSFWTVSALIGILVCCRWNTYLSPGQNKELVITDNASRASKMYRKMIYSQFIAQRSLELWWCYTSNNSHLSSQILRYSATGQPNLKWWIWTDSCLVCNCDVWA